ncbi:hypothetical protein V8G54_009841 [Vigna mungo]|uniref:Aminotransferase-like plant mobile domain-containing protein n=1 Tax=Vigna mungo TaxID=3915 RepID=A0AAQ3NVK2_VIGMU
MYWHHRNTLSPRQHSSLSTKPNSPFLKSLDASEIVFVLSTIEALKLHIERYHVRPPLKFWEEVLWEGEVFFDLIPSLKTLIERFVSRPSAIEVLGGSVERGLALSFVVQRRGLWQVRAWMDTSHIVHMNSLLQARHERRVQETPFKWCLDIVNPIELNLKLLKQLVRRWVPHHQSFRVRHQLVPFDVVDIVMTLGLGVGGWRNSRHVSNMPCVVLDDLDSLCKYDWSGTIHTYLLHSLNRCNRKILTRKIVDSISISGSVVVLQLWASERLGLHSNSSIKVFPRLQRFRSLNYGTEAIDLLFKKGKVSNENPIVRAAFNMDGVGKSEGAPEKGDDSCERACAARVEKIRINNQKIRSLKDEIVGIRKVLSARRKRRNVEDCRSIPEVGFVVEGQGNVEAADAAPVEETTSQVVEEADADATPVEEAAADEDGAHEAADEAVVDEIPANAAGVEEAPVHETTADKDDAHQAADEAVVDEPAADEAPVDEAAATVDEQVVAEEAVDEEVDDEVPPRDPPAFVHIGGEDQDDEIIPHVEPIVIEPLSILFGDP